MAARAAPAMAPVREAMAGMRRNVPARTSRSAAAPAAKAANRGPAAMGGTAAAADPEGKAAIVARWAAMAAMAEEADRPGRAVPAETPWVLRAMAGTVAMAAWPAAMAAPAAMQAETAMVAMAASRRAATAPA